jgi:hypothetical protein
MRKTDKYCKVAAIALFGIGLLLSASAEVVVIVRNGADAVSQAESEALRETTPASVLALAEDGFIIIQVENGVTLAIDPNTPLLAAILRERLLLEAFGDLKSPKRFADFDKVTQRVVKDILTDFVPGREVGPETKFLVRAEAKFTLRFSGKSMSHSATYPLAGPSTFDAMRMLADSPLKIRQDWKPELRQRDSTEFADNLRPVFSLEWRAQILRKCQERFAAQVDVEIQARRSVMSEMLAKLPSPPSETTTPADLAAEHLKQMRENLLGSWSIYGFSSRAEASEAWDSAAWTSPNVEFTLLFGDTSGDFGGSPILGGIGFGVSGR